MWTPVEKLLKTKRADEQAPSVPPVVVPLRKSGPDFSSITEGSVISFSDQCPLPQLRGQSARIEKLRQYQFGADAVRTFRLAIGKHPTFSFSIAEDDQGQYLAISRLLSPTEQDQWFGNDALSFFTEPSTAKTIRCKADLAKEGAWAAERYVKSVDWLQGAVSEGKLELSFFYNLLVNESGEKALEIEHYPTLKKNQVYLTVYRPIEDILHIREASQPVPTPAATPAPAPTPSAAPPVTTPVSKSAVPADEPVVLTELLTEPTPRIPRGDFRRTSDPAAPIHVAATHAPIEAITPKQLDNTPPLPSFLLSREHNYLSLDAVIPPESERVRLGLMTAKQLIETALLRGVRVRDILREQLGLESMLSEEVIFELPLSDTDYRVLAMRYKMRPDHRDQIRARMQQELRNKLLGSVSG